LYAKSLEKKPELRSRSPDSLLTLPPSISKINNPSTYPRNQLILPNGQEKKVVFHSVSIISCRSNSQTHLIKFLSSSYSPFTFHPGQWMVGHSCFFPPQTYSSIHCINKHLCDERCAAFLLCSLLRQFRCRRTFDLEYQTRVIFRERNSNICDVIFLSLELLTLRRASHPNYRSFLSQLWIPVLQQKVALVLYAPCTLHSGYQVQDYCILFAMVWYNIPIPISLSHCLLHQVSLLIPSCHPFKCNLDLEKNALNAALRLPRAHAMNWTVQWTSIHHSLPHKCVFTSTPLRLSLTAST
jgi:hypothetical protein